jgi:hypothetical protein
MMVSVKLAASAILVVGLAAALPLDSSLVESDEAEWHCMNYDHPELGERHSDHTEPVSLWNVKAPAEPHYTEWRSAQYCGGEQGAHEGPGGAN